MLREVFPSICSSDCRWRRGDIRMSAPTTLPSVFVEEASNLKARGGHAHRIEVRNEVRYVYVLQPDYIERAITDSWVEQFENARAGELPARAAYANTHRICFGLARVHQPGDGETFACTCCDFYERLICPHIIYVMDLWGLRSLDEHTTVLGRKKTRKGRLRRRRGALTRQPETPQSEEPSQGRRRRRP